MLFIYTIPNDKSKMGILENPPLVIERVEDHFNNQSFINSNFFWKDLYT